SALGSPKCREETVAAGAELRLVPERPPLGWVRLDWRVIPDRGNQHRILTADRNKSRVSSSSSFLGRAFYNAENLSLWITRVTTADSGVYKADFQAPSGSVVSICFHVSVWEPLGQLLLEANVLHKEQDRCNLSLLCSVPGASNLSYSWSCTGGPLGTLKPQPQLELQVLGDTDPTVCACNASNPVSWSKATTDVTAACHSATGFLDILPWWAVALILLLVLAIFIAVIVTCHWCRKRRQDPPAGQAEQPMTVYEEVGKPRTGQPPPRNGTSETTMGEVTIYASITKAQGPSRPPDPECCTIYTTIQPSRKLPRCLTAGSPSASQPPSVKKKRLDPALVSTAYTEV
ncbi:CD244 protein, partial [Jacana jacana]|nr:CD244 protein [Jacana jacana]